MAAVIARRQMDGAAAAAFLHPRPPVQTRNHMKENLRAMREKERANRGRKIMEGSAQPPELFRLNRFKDVPSRLMEAKVQMRPGSGNRMHSEPPGGRVKPRTPVARSDNNEGDGQEGKEEEMNLADFEALVEDMKRKHAGKGNQIEVKKDANNCPSYLRKIKDDLAEKEYQTALANRKPDAPPGYRRLPAEEIQETLAALKKKKEEADKEFRALPLSIVTDSQKRREKIVKEKMEEVEKAIKMFSTPIVLVPL